MLSPVLLPASGRASSPQCPERRWCCKVGRAPCFPQCHGTLGTGPGGDGDRQTGKTETDTVHPSKPGSRSWEHGADTLVGGLRSYRGQGVKIREGLGGVDRPDVAGRRSARHWHKNTTTAFNFVYGPVQKKTEKTLQAYWYWQQMLSISIWSNNSKCWSSDRKCLRRWSKPEPVEAKEVWIYHTGSPTEGPRTGPSASTAGFFTDMLVQGGIYLERDPSWLMYVLMQIWLLFRG